MDRYLLPALLCAALLPGCGGPKSEKTDDGDDRIRMGGFPRLTQLVRVPRMEGVVLGNHADNAHGKTPFNEQ